MHELIVNLFTNVRSVLRFRWYGMLVAWVGCIVGWAYISTMSDVYAANTRVYLDTSSELAPLLRGQIVEQDVSEQLLYVQEALLGRDSMERVLDNTALSDRIESSEQREAMLANLARSINVSADGGNNRNQGNNRYEITYLHAERDIARSVVEQLLAAFQDTTRSAGEFGAGTSEAFLQQRIEVAEQRLANAESELAQFKREHADRLPGADADYYTRMRNEQEQLAQANRDRRIAQSRRDQIQAQLDGEQALVPGTGDAELQPDSLDGRIQSLERELDDLLQRYTERHPTVIATQEQLGRLREQRALELRSLGVANEDTPLSALELDPVYQQLRMQLNEADLEITTLEADIREREANVAELQGLINEVPEVERELQSLNRDYDLIFENYENLVRSREAQELTREANRVDNVDFRIIDPPTVSANPVAPNRLLLVVAAFMGAVGAGGALCYILAQLWPVFGSARNLRLATDLPVIGVVTNAYTQSRRSEQRRRAFAFVGCFILLTGAFLGIVAIEAVGPGLNSLISGA